MFNYSLLIPPNHCLFELKYKYSSVHMYFPSATEVPTVLNDSNIKLLFSVMNTSIIIKLYCCLLTERKIVLVSEAPTLLYKICNGLFKLIFPFKWMHTFIPVIDEDQIDLLEAPVPYVIGLVSSVNNLNELSTRFTESVFVNIDTNEICFPASIRDIGLSEQEENDIKKNIQKLKNAELLMHMNNNTSDLNVNFSFSKNVLNLFFKKIESVLRSYRQYLEYCHNEYYPFYGEKLRIEFNETLFKSNVLKDFNKNSKELWNKVITSNVFLDFINNNLHPQQLTSTYIFNRIVECEEQVDNSILNAYIMKLKINDFNKEFVLNVIKESNSEIQNEFTEYYNSDNNNNNNVYKGHINLSNKQNQQYINLFENKTSNQSILNTPLVASLNLSISNELTFDSHIMDSNSFYGDKGFISFIKQLSSVPNFSQLLTYHLTQISQELQNNMNNNNNTHLCYFEFPLDQTQINNNYEKFFHLILTALYLQANLSNSPNSNEPSSSSHIATLYKRAHSLNKIEFPYYKYFNLITRNTSISKQFRPKDSILLYEIHPHKLSSKSKEAKQSSPDIFPETSSTDFLNKISVEIKKEIIQERTTKLASNINQNSNTNSININFSHIEQQPDIVSVHSVGRFSSSKIRCLKTDLTSYTVINKKIFPQQQAHVYSPTKIINNLFTLLTPIYTKNRLNLHNAIKTISEEDYLAIKNNIGGLKKINISKITDMNSKICFWLNLFNILLLFTLIYTRIEPININHWKDILINAYFDIGGYEIALRDFYFQFLNVNFLVEQVSKEKEKINALMKRFVVNGIDKLKQYLLIFGIHLPGFHNENLIKFEEANVFEQLSELFNSFVMKNVKFNKEKKYLFITEMFLTFDMNFLFESYKMCESILNKEIYEILDKNQYVEIKMLPKEEASRIDEFVSLNEILPEVRSSKVNK